ncbi:MAG TPA: hypothetical protein VG188_14165 [Solirubrobacteraceae bacterium]|nr:hypothetical protein [Solirubrobacteraceae bacterium]
MLVGIFQTLPGRRILRNVILYSTMNEAFWKRLHGRTISGPCAVLLEGLQETVGFVFFVTDLATRADDMRLMAAKALAEGSSSREEDRDALKDAEENRVVTSRLRAYRQVIFQTLITRSVDHYLSYVSGLLSEVFRERPETLRSSEQVRIDFVLRHETMDELVSALAERRVDRLAYRGLRELAADLKDNLGLVLFDNDNDLPRAERIIEARNLIVHNHGIVSPKYLRKVPNSSTALGQRLSFDFDGVIADITFLADCALRTDDLACRKFPLTQRAALPRDEPDRG